MENIRKLVIISGVSSGLGYHLARLLINENYKVFGIYRSFNENIQYLTQRGCFLIEWDLENLAGFDSFQAEIGRIIDENAIESIIFINNASTINPIGHLKDFSDKEIINIISVNITNSILITKSVISRDLKVEIINISSGAADRAIPGWSMYCMSKSANKMFFNVLQTQYPQIKFQNIDPGIVDTNMQRKIRSVDKNSFPLLDEFVKYHEEGKLQNPEIVAKMIISRISV